MHTLATVQNTLGECPVWSPHDATLYWMDIQECALYACSAATRNLKRWDMPEYPGGLAVREKGGLVIGLQSSIAAFDPETGQLEDIVSFDGLGGDGMRFNDAKCDRAGRFFIGSMKDPAIAQSLHAEKEKQGAGSLFMLDTDCTLHVIDTGFTIPNGFAWSLDDSLLYVSDSEEKTVFVYDYDPDRAELANRRIFVDMSDGAGVPDGAVIDSEGCLWSVRHGEGRIIRYDPDGKEMRSIRLPVAKPTSLTFGGEAFDTLFVTSATQELSPDERARQPQAGMVFMLEADMVGVTGLPEPTFRG